MSSYAKNKLQMCWGTQRQCRSRQMWKIFTNSPSSTHFLSITKNDLSWLNNPFMVSFQLISISLLLGSTVVSPYVGMARKQNGGYNASISVQTPIFHLVVNSTRLKTARSARWCCPNSTMAPRLLENVVKVTNLEWWKSSFVIFFSFFFFLFLLQPA